MNKFLLWRDFYFLLFAVGLLAPQLAIAQCVPNPNTKETREQCASLWKVEASLKRMLEELQARTDKTGQKKLEQANAAWQDLRHKECVLEADYFRGTAAQSLKYIECKIRLIQTQSQAVSEQLQLRRCTDNLCEE